MGALHWWYGGDLVTRASALVLLAMSVASWVVMLWKLHLLRRAHTDLARSLAAFWQAPDWREAQAGVAAFDRDALVRPLVAAAQAVQMRGSAHPPSAWQGPLQAQATRALRGALQASCARLQFGQVLLATVGATAPFVGLLGTVWGIYHALVALAGSGQISIERLAGPVGEALVMTAAGLAVAIPAVLGYNALGRTASRLEADLEGFAHDLRALCAPSQGD